MTTSMRTRIGGTCAALATPALLALGLGACGDDDETDTAGEATTTVEETTTTEADGETTSTDADPSMESEVVDLEQAEEEGTADDLVGQTVTVRGEVGEVIGRNTVRVGGEGAGSGTLVLSTDEGTEVEVGTTIEATGEVVEYVVEDLGEEFDITIDDEAAILEDEYAVVVEEITVSS